MGVIIDPAAVGRADIGGDPAAAAAEEELLDRPVRRRDHRRAARRHDVDRIVDARAAGAGLRCRCRRAGRPDARDGNGEAGGRDIGLGRDSRRARPKSPPGSAPAVVLAHRVAVGGEQEQAGQKKAHDRADSNDGEERQPAHDPTNPFRRRIVPVTRRKDVRRASVPESAGRPAPPPPGRPDRSRPRRRRRGNRRRPRPARGRCPA